MTRLSAFARFWYDFIVGDDWRVAVGGRRGDRADRGACVSRAVGVVVDARRGGRDAVRVAVASHRTASMTARVYCGS
jgi:hypothetical protein